jgi:hypothetical protein
VGIHVPSEPVLTPSKIANIPFVLKQTLGEMIQKQERKKRKSTLVSSNSLANRFIHLQWAIRPSQRRQYRNLFSTVREQCRTLFQYYIRQGEIIDKRPDAEHRYHIYRFDEIRGNPILGFVYAEEESAFLGKQVSNLG